MKTANKELARQLLEMGNEGGKFLAMEDLEADLDNCQRWHEAILTAIAAKEYAITLRKIIVEMGTKENICPHEYGLEDSNNCDCIQCHSCWGGATHYDEVEFAMIKRLHWFKAVAEKLHKQLLQESKRFGFTVPATLDDVATVLKGGEPDEESQ